MKNIPEAKLMLDRARRRLAKKYKLLLQDKLQNPRAAPQILAGYRNSLKALKDEFRRKGKKSLPTVKQGAEELITRLENTLPKKGSKQRVEKKVKNAPTKTIQPDMSLQKQLQGKGQLRDLRTNPNLRGIDLEYWLQKTPEELKEARDDANNKEMSKRIYKLLMKAFEKRDLGKRGKG